MKINATTLRTLDTNKSYYLSSATGEIKQSGFGRWLKCVFNIGNARAEAAALADKVKAALLADGAVENDATLDGDIAALNKNRSLSGSALVALANRFRTTHAEAVGRADARYAAEQLAETIVDAWVSTKCAHPDPDSVACLKRLAVYAAAPVIENPGKYPDDASFKHALRSKMELLNTFLGSSAFFSEQCKLGYPLAQSLNGADGKKVSLVGPRFKLDELHFRLFLGCMADSDGDVRFNELCDNLRHISEGNLQAMKSKILALPLPDAARPGAVVTFANSLRALSNEQAVYTGVIFGKGGAMPKCIARGLDKLLGEMRGVYGEESVPANADFYKFVPGAVFGGAVRPIAATATAQHRFLGVEETKDALRDECRQGAASEFAQKAVERYAAANGLEKPATSFGIDLLKRKDALREELLACKNPGEAEEVMKRHEDDIREQLEFVKSVAAERGKLKDIALDRIADALGVSADEAEGMTDFGRLTLMAGDMARKMVAGTYPGCKEKGFDVAATFTLVVDRFVKTRVDLIREVDEQEGVSKEVKALWKKDILKTQKPDELHASRIMKLMAHYGDNLMRNRLHGVIDPGITVEERAKRLCDFAGSLNAEFVTLFGEEDWTEMGPDERDPLFEMLLRAVVDKMPDFTGNFGAVREEFAKITRAQFDAHESGAVGEKIYQILACEIAPEEE